jgi:membrane protein implicated in regulation of membrane protease activity
MAPHLLALALGVIAGLAFLGLLLCWRRALAIRMGNSLVTDADFIGQVGLVVLPCSTQERGLVRLTVRGALMDVPAYSNDTPLPRGLRVMVLHRRGCDVWVTSLARMGR